MSESDEYRSSDGEEAATGTTRATVGTRAKTRLNAAYATDDGSYTWTADYKRSWDTVQEDASGSIAGVVASLIESGKRKRWLKDATPVQRGIIRHMVLVLDFGVSMSEQDLRPTRHELSLTYAATFVSEYYEQNPISQLAIIAMSNGIAQTISPLSGNPQDHLLALASCKKRECSGNVSLQNALEMARATLYHVPSHGTREVLVIFGALVSADPGDIHKTIASLVSAKIRVRIIGLAASLAICREIVSKTSGGSVEGYGVILNEYHFKDLLMAATTPPATLEKSTKSLIMIGFPSRLADEGPSLVADADAQASLCACHARLTVGGYRCPRCSAKICTLPAECPACKLTLVLSTHLARSYHHLFPLRNWQEAPDSSRKEDLVNLDHCFACQQRFPTITELTASQPGMSTHQSNGQQERSTSRYACTSCGLYFCIDCDLFAHEQLYECFGCQAGYKANKRRSSINARNGASTALAGIDEDVAMIED
ncbi:Ssl1-like-domain-containing protein [Protomyces lactucae-debilis]|uniref:General transcription and DNA repair factor IIH n=1 Tax=Protomyces lactucae-debilis TaxID=2754530 RepID=A0A1Y2F3W4_PROLT|nr:Ssl1-like-domain-containing protein [Protomyces lactucae-debilis]ORY78600.1 Ssl1-like-domain-containing protein [Protomyces lactucae-debilis]